MIKSIFSLSVFVFLFALNSLAAPRANHVVIISIDGGKPSVLKKSDMPALHGLTSVSAYTWNAVTVRPNVTLPSHTSMLTGVGPEIHHITWNSWIPAKGLLKFPTIFCKVHSAGMTTALFAAKEKFKHLEIKGSYNVFDLKAGSEGVSQAAAKAIVETKPNLLFAHLPEADHFGHRHGWGSKVQIEEIKKVDKGIATILAALVQAGIADSSVVIITADHGGFGWSHGLSIPANYTIPWIAFGKGVQKGKQLAKGIRTVDTAATALWLLGLDPSGIDGRPITDAFKFN